MPSIANFNPFDSFDSSNLRQREKLDPFFFESPILCHVFTSHLHAQSSVGGRCEVQRSCCQMVLEKKPHCLDWWVALVKWYLGPMEHHDWAPKGSGLKVLKLPGFAAAQEIWEDCDGWGGELLFGLWELLHFGVVWCCIKSNVNEHRSFASSIITQRYILYIYIYGTPPAQEHYEDGPEATERHCNGGKHKVDRLEVCDDTMRLMFELPLRWWQKEYKTQSKSQRSVRLIRLGACPIRPFQSSLGAWPCLASAGIMSSLVKLWDGSCQIMALWASGTALEYQHIPRT